MAARKKASRKKATRKKGTRKKAAKKKGTRKKASRKKTSKKKGGKKKAARSLVGSELPKSLSAFSRQLKRDLNSIEKEIEDAGRGTRRSLARILRDASSQLGRLEARGQKEWRSLSKKAQREVDNIVRRVKKAAGTS